MEFRKIKKEDVERVIEQSLQKIPSRKNRIIMQGRYYDELKNAGERIEMKIIYDPQTDSLTLILREMAVKESDEIREDLIVDYGEDDKIIAIEVLNASENISEPQAFLYEIKGQKAVPKAIA